RRLGGVPHPDIAAGAGYVLDVELRLEMLRQFLSERAREQVGRAARRERNDDAYGMRGIGLRPAAPWRGEAGANGTRGEPQNTTTIERHLFPSDVRHRGYISAATTWKGLGTAGALRPRLRPTLAPKMAPKSGFAGETLWRPRPRTVRAW